MLYNLPLANERSLLIPKIDLIVQATPVVVEDYLDDGIDDFTAVHGDADDGRRLWVVYCAWRL